MPALEFPYPVAYNTLMHPNHNLTFYINLTFGWLLLINTMLFLQDNLVSGLIEMPEKNTDLDPRMLEAYINLCTAEAQESGYFCMYYWYLIQ